MARNTENRTETEQVEPEAVNEEQPQTEPEPDTAALNTAIDEAKAKLAEAESKLNAAAESRDMPAMLQASDEVKAAQRGLNKAEDNFKAANWKARQQERDEVAGEIRRMIEELTFDTARYRDLDITGFGVLFTDEGIQVTVQAPKAPSGRGRAKGGTTRTPASPRRLWSFNGEEYSSAELLETFGGEEGMDAVLKSRRDGPQGWVARGLASGPGFDAPLKKLAKRMGWNGDAENRELHHLPE